MEKYDITQPVIGGKISTEQYALEELEKLTKLDYEKFDNCKIAIDQIVELRKLFPVMFNSAEDYKFITLCLNSHEETVKGFLHRIIHNKYYNC